MFDVNVVAKVVTILTSDKARSLPNVTRCCLSILHAMVAPVNEDYYSFSVFRNTAGTCIIMCTPFPFPPAGRSSPCEGRALTVTPATPPPPRPPAPGADDGRTTRVAAAYKPSPMCAVFLDSYGVMIPKVTQAIQRHMAAEEHLTVLGLCVLGSLATAFIHRAWAWTPLASHSNVGRVGVDSHLPCVDWGEGEGGGRSAWARGNALGARGVPCRFSGQGPHFARTALLDIGHGGHGTGRLSTVGRRAGGCFSSGLCICDACVKAQRAGRGGAARWPSRRRGPGSGGGEVRGPL